MVKKFARRVSLCLALTTPVWANPPTTAVLGTPPQPSWSALTLQQREILSPLSKDWDELEHIRRKKWLLIAERFPAMKPEEQKRVQDRMREWVRMTPEQRNKVRDSYKEFNQLPSEQKQVVKQKWETYNNLSEEEKSRIKAGGKPEKPQDKPALPVSESAPPANIEPGKKP